MHPVPMKDLLEIAKDDDEQKQAEKTTQVQQTLEALVKADAVRKEDNWMSGERYQLIGHKALVYYVSLLQGPQKQQQ